MKSTLDEFFGENGTQANQILELYLQALSQINSTPDSPDPEAENFVLSFNETLLYLTKRLGKRSFADYEESIKALFKEIDNRVVAIFNSTYITGLPPKGIQNVKDLLGIWSKFDVSLKHTSEFKSFIEAMSLNGTPVDDSITESYFQTFMKQYADMAKPVGPHVFGYGYPQEEVDAATTETVRLTPPTGEDTKTLLVRSNKQMINTVSLIAVISVIVILVAVVVNKAGKNKLYK